MTTRAGDAVHRGDLRVRDARSAAATACVRLIGDKAWTLMTALDELKGHEERTGKRRPTGQSYSRDFRGPNWLDQRKAAAAYADSDPAVLVVGGGQAGLSIAARLTQLGVDTLIVDRGPRIGDNWRNRYHALTLHNQVQVNHLPYMPFPPNWPTYIPKDKLADWFEAYVESMELNYWTGTEFAGRRYDETSSAGPSRCARDGTTRTMHPRHIVMATGVSGIPNMPGYSGAEGFRRHRCCIPASTATARTGGQARARDRHRQQRPRHRAGSLFQRRAGHAGAAQPDADRQHRAERAACLHALRRRAAARGLRPHRGVDAASLVRKSHQSLTEQGEEAGQAAARRAGAQRLQARLRRGRHRLAVQVSDARRRLLFQRRLLRPDRRGQDRARAVLRHRALRRGRRAHARREHDRADLIVLATGYKGQEQLVRKLFGEEVAARVGPIWGFGDGQELRNMFMRTPQPGLWFIAGSLAQCRIYSKYLALQIKAIEEGLLRKQA